MKKKVLRKTVGILTATLMTGMLLVSGCGKSEGTNAAPKAAKEGTLGEDGERQDRGQFELDENAIFGKVISIDGDTLTVALAQMPEMPEDMQQRPDGEMPEDMPQPPDGEMPEDMPQPPDGEAPEDMPEWSEGERPEGGGMEITLTGEEELLTVTEATTYDVRGEEGSLESIQVDDIVTITLSQDGTIESIRLSMFGGIAENKESSESV